MRSFNSLVLAAMFSAAPAHATQVCAWMEESVEPYEDEMAAEDGAAADDDVAAAAAEAAAAAGDAAEAAMDAASDVADAAGEAADAAAAAAGTDFEASEPAGGGMHNLKLWLQADADADFYYKMAGKGLVQDEGGSGHSPNSGTYVLEANTPSSPWGFGMTFDPPGIVDVVVEIRAFPEDIFDEKDPPLLASFTFARKVPAGEAAPPATLAAHQCKDITFPKPKD